MSPDSLQQAWPFCILPSGDMELFRLMGQHTALNPQSIQHTSAWTQALI